ncbi:MAG TPA: hypothetical protein VHV31_08950 [Nitrolancea sp.]|nr:hypothetical protein [Nitrolancea sp.]
MVRSGLRALCPWKPSQQREYLDCGRSDSSTNIPNHPGFSQLNPEDVRGVDPGIDARDDRQIEGRP